MSEAEKKIIDDELIHSAEEIREAIAVLAKNLNRDYAGQELHVLCLLNGALVFTASLFSQLEGPVTLDYIHATRYGNSDKGGELLLRAAPGEDLKSKTVLLLDDIFDQGETLRWVAEYCKEQGATKVISAVLAVKDLRDTRERDKLNQPDYHALRVPDRYVYGYGMDVAGYWRNLPAIYAKL
ncbi:MAG: hypoxanthine phosphoribosyltransferase [Flavobacteriales bacterium]|jgi:hypoxanthine phosphoribosyltransferase